MGSTEGRTFLLRHWVCSVLLSFGFEIADRRRAIQGIWKWLGGRESEQLVEPPVWYYACGLGQLGIEGGVVDSCADERAGDVGKEGTFPTKRVEIDGGEMARIEMVATLKTDGEAGGRRKRWYRTREGGIDGRSEAQR